MKNIILSLFCLVSLSGFSTEKLGEINDPDGYSNVRKNQSSDSKILFVINKGEYFYFQNNDLSPWFEITSMDGNKGFMHKSRILEVESIEINGTKYKTSEIKLKIRKKSVGNQTAVITQVRNLKNSIVFSCNSYLDLYYPNGDKKTIEFEDIQGLGGSSGISFLEKITSSHLLIVKHGDYDGRTIIISESGELINIGGGTVSKIIEDRFIISFGECDLGYCSFFVYDLKTNNIVLKHDIEFKVYQLNGKIIFDLDYDNGGDFRELNTKNMELNRIKISKDNLKNLNTFTKYDIENGCLCY